MSAGSLSDILDVGKGKSAPRKGKGKLPQMGTSPQKGNGQVAAGRQGIDAQDLGVEGKESITGARVWL